MHKLNRPLHRICRGCFYVPAKSGLRFRSDRIGIRGVGWSVPGVRFFLFLTESWIDGAGILVPAP